MAHSGGKGLLVAQRPTRELEANVGYDDAGQNRTKEIYDEARRNDFSK
ncbi:MAG TPA: hypothetical protein VH024_04290 [Candidatus Angelobacter sp.]|nr:hypothetical protein [Candidatus Angelobacter sp.]